MSYDDAILFQICMSGKGGIPWQSIMLYQRGNYAVKQNEQTLLVLSAARLNGGSDAAVGPCAAGDHYQIVLGAPRQGIKKNSQ